MWVFSRDNVRLYAFAVVSLGHFLSEQLNLVADLRSSSGLISHRCLGSANAVDYHAGNGSPDKAANRSLQQLLSALLLRKTLAVTCEQVSSNLYDRAGAGRECVDRACTHGRATYVTKPTDKA